MAREQLSERQIEAAVEWWAGKLRKPSFSALTPEERSRPANRHLAAAEVVAAKGGPQITEEQVERFRDALRDRLTGWDPLYDVSTDYHPDRTLAAALAAAGIPDDMMTLPWKTRMWFRDGGVQAAEGYGARAEELLQ